MPDAYDDFMRSVAVASLFVSNVHFLGFSGYFDQASELRPLLHTWCLAIEEQFYLLFPLLQALLSAFRRQKHISVVGTLAILSLLLGEWALRYFPEENFFFKFSRIWELFAGSLCAFIAFRRDISGNRHTNLLKQRGQIGAGTKGAQPVRAFCAKFAKAMPRNIGKQLALQKSWVYHLNELQRGREQKGRPLKTVYFVYSANKQLQGSTNMRAHQLVAMIQPHLQDTFDLQLSGVRAPPKFMRTEFVMAQIYRQWARGLHPNSYGVVSKACIPNVTEKLLEILRKKNIKVLFDKELAQTQVPHGQSAPYHH
ncbi:acyltransferase family protein [Marimonas lutisalis]|uniref:acyltransferase n=1 Tax=Marimonas lutisalis TaxID=2545756 RepID=UPI0010F84B2A|nr:acyltransferase [Marimonas lutisalis]